MESSKIRKYTAFYFLALLLITTSCSKSYQLDENNVEVEQGGNIVSGSVVEVNNEDSIQNESNNKQSFKSQTSLYLRIVKSFYLFFVPFLLGGLFMYLFLYYKIKQILFDDWEKYKQKLKQDSNNRFSPLIIYKYTELLKERKDFHKEESSTKENLLRIKQDNNKKNKVAKAKSNMDEIKETNKKELEEKEKTELFVTYFQIPDRDGFFDLDYSEESLSENCFYAIESKDNKNGKLLFNTEAIARLAFNNIDDYLKPACEIENEGLLVSAKKIEMVQTGSVKLSNNKWVVNDKIKIKFI